MISKILFYITQCYGLSPFKYNKSTSRIFESNLLVLVNLIAGLSFCLFALWSQMYTILTWLPNRPKTVLLVVSYMEGFFVVIEHISIFFIQFSNRKTLLKFINEGFELTSELRKICPEEAIFSIQFRKYLRSKVMTKSFQIVLLCFTTLSFCVRENNILEWLGGLLGVTIYIYPMMISSIYYCGSVIISARFYEILNLTIVSLISSMESKQCLQTQLLVSDIYDEIDYIAVLYNRIVSFVELINKLLSLQIVIIKLTSFILIISSVIYRNFHLKFHRKWNKILVLSRYFFCIVPCWSYMTVMSMTDFRFCTKFFSQWALLV